MNFFSFLIRSGLFAGFLGGFAESAWAAPAEPAGRLQNLLMNAGMETFSADSGLPGSFTLAVYGAPPQIAADTGVFAGGRQSLRVSATQPSDTAIAQDVTVRPGGVYRFSGRVRTRDLVPEESSWTHGTFQIQDSAGRVIGRMRNHRGTTDWTRESVHFRAPADGRLHVVCFFVGYGKGTGTAWFDELGLEEAPAGDTLIVTPARLQPTPISPFIYGNFVELLSDLVPSMWAEMLDATSFEYLRADEQRQRASRFVHDPVRDPKDRLWRPAGDPSFAAIELDAGRPFNGAVSQRIELKAGGTEAGIWQDGMAVEDGESYRFVGHLRARNGGRVRVELRDGDRVLAAGMIDSLTGEWQRRELTLKAAGSAPYARFVLRLAEPGTVWVDRVSLVPVKNVAGWRADVVEALKAMRPGILRWGGSVIEGYDWKDLVGPWENRVPFPNRYWGRIDPNFVGINEFIDLCRAVGAEPLICVRWSGQKPSDAADLVEYCNGGPDTRMGGLRLAHGYAQPHRVKYFQIGNEMGGPEYAATVADFARAMKKADPSIELLACYISEEILRNAADLLDFVSPHPYDAGNLEGTAAQLDQYADLVRGLSRGKRLGIAATEWNTTAGEWGTPGRTRMMTLGNAITCARFLHLCQRRSEFVKIGCRSNISNSYGSGIIQTSNRMVIKTPAYHALRLYAEHAGRWPLMLGENAAALPVDASATLSDDGRTLALLIVNPQTDPVEQAIDLSAFPEIANEAEAWTLADVADARDPDVMNSFERPERVRVVSGRFDRAARQFVYRVPALSVIVLKIRVGATGR